MRKLTPSMQVDDSNSLPTQPSCPISPLTHVRVWVRIPRPHVTEHEDHGPQPDHVGQLCNQKLIEYCAKQLLDQ